jgi:hypothetical protein
MRSVLQRAIQAGLATVVLALLVTRVVAAVIVVEDVVPGATGPNPPGNWQLNLTLLRLRTDGKRAVSDAGLTACRAATEVMAKLKATGKGCQVDVLAQARQSLTLSPSGEVVVRAAECRPVICLDAGASGSVTNHDYGLDLRAIAREVVASRPGQPGTILLDWNGKWRGSPGLLIDWERVAVKAFNLARVLPGVGYENQEPDEDGFVNTSGGSDVSRLFKRKRKDDPAGKAPVDTGKNGKASAPVPLPEPSYLADTARREVEFRGTTFCRGGQLVIHARPFSDQREEGILYLILQPVSLD